MHVRNPFRRTIRAANSEQAAPIDWQAIVAQRERELKAVGDARHTAEQHVKNALDVVHEWQRDGEPNDYLTRVHRELVPPTSGVGTTTL